MKEILSNLEAILQRGYSSYTVFNDWLELMILSLQRDDEPYLQIVKQYKNNQEIGKREIDYFAKAFGALLTEMHKTNDDILGLLYMQWNQTNKYWGQYFTPKHVAGFMAQSLEVKKGNVLDPACGSGIMLIETIKTMTNVQLDQSVFYGQDIDYACVKMCALNLTFFNVNGFVIWGDSLANECSRVFETSRSYVGGSIRELKGENLERFRLSYVGSLSKSFDTRKAKPQTEIVTNNPQEFTNQNPQLMLF